MKLRELPKAIAGRQMSLLFDGNRLDGREREPLAAYRRDGRCARLPVPDEIGLMSTMADGHYRC